MKPEKAAATRKLTPEEEAKERKRLANMKYMEDRYKEAHYAGDIPRKLEVDRMMTAVENDPAYGKYTSDSIKEYSDKSKAPSALGKALSKKKKAKK